MELAGSILALLCFVGVALFYWQQVFEETSSAVPRGFVVWFGKGVVTPLFLWSVVCHGIPSVFPPFGLLIGAGGAGGGNFWPVFFEMAAAGLWVIGSYWAAVTLGWLAATIVLRSEHRRDYLGVWVVWSLLLVPVAAVVIAVLGWAGLGLAGSLWVGAVVHQMLPLVAAKPLPPSYARAIAKMKFGKYDEAEWEVIHELEKCEDDFEGWMMLAELYALHFHDLEGADLTVRDVCNQPKITPSQLTVAFQRLADWHLKVGSDPVSARRALEEICRRLPSSHLDKMARLRINGLPATREALREEQRGKKFRLPVFNESYLQETEDRKADRTAQEAKVRADQCVAKLKSSPDDIPAREEFAHLLAEELGQVDLALEQMELLLAMPACAPRKIAEWLSTMARWQLRLRRDTEAGRDLLERLVREHPQTPHAFEAQARLNLIKIEERMRRARAPVVVLPE